jgi:hypothetical protein
VQDVLVELRGDAARIVVGELEHVGILDEIGTEQEPVPRIHEGGDPRQKRAARPRPEVADRAAQERDQPALLARHPLEMGLVVADDAVHLQPLVLADELGGRAAGDLLRDIDRHVGLERSGVPHRVEQSAGLRRGAGAELDQRRCARGLDDLGCPRVEDLPLGSGRVVLG